MQAKNWIPEIEELALTAGKIIQRGFESTKTVHEKSSAMDIVTEFDTEVENVLRKEINTRYPEHLVLGEEEEFRTEGAFGAFLPRKGYVWVIDPIDGTLNFASGIPLLAVSIALFHEGELLAGVVYNPIIKEMFSAQKGAGATLNNQVIKVKKDSGLARAIVAVSVARRKKDLELSRLADKVGGMRALGTAAVALAYVAAGRLDAYWEVNLNLWDVAAGVLLVEEAGGEVMIPNQEREYPVKIAEIIGAGNKPKRYYDVLKNENNEQNKS
ncbi:inositol monophosphatase family protein [Desulfitobacterium sp. AusDCA]|uniref:inositol monophosphatase family protein n=1 Tax=Desulfitobacterium sp. AusDCA TaxID=3240383 RepID=UPI003DA7784B